MEETIGSTLLVIFFIFFFGILSWLILNITKELMETAFPETFENVKLYFGEPKTKFTARIISVGKVKFRGFYATIYLFEKALIVRHLNRATLIKDLSNLKLSGKFVSILTIENETSPIKLTLGIKEYNIIKEFLEANNG